MNALNYKSINEEIYESSGGNIILEEYVDPNIAIRVKYKVRRKFKCLLCNEYWFSSAKSVINNELKKCPYCNGTRYRHRDIVSILKGYGITYLEEEFKSVKLENKLQCNICKHIWSECLAGIKKIKIKCPNCNKVKRYKFEDVVAFLNQRNIEFVDEKYINSKYKHKLRCKVCNTEWLSAVGRILRNDSGCQRCSHNSHILSKEVIDKICEDKKVQMLSEYKGITTFCNFKCLTCGFVNSTNLHRIRISKHGCVKCSGNSKYTLEGAKQKCLDKNVEFVDNFYKDHAYRYNFKCNECNYEWQSTFKYVSRHGCQKCNGYNKRRSIEEIKKACKKYDVICLSDKIKKNGETYKFKCMKCEVEWEDTLSNFFNHNKCPNKKCRYVNLFGENLVRGIFERIFRKKFIKIKPDWLRNPKTGYKLELDGFNEELKLAFEYNGRQHYELVEGFKMTVERLEMQKYIDNFKVNKCSELGIKLIVIPQVNLYIKVTELEEYISKQLKLNNICNQI